MQCVLTSMAKRLPHDCHTIATRLPHDCHWKLLQFEHRPLTEAHMYDVYHKASSPPAPHVCKYVVIYSGNRVAIVWQSCGSRVAVVWQSFGH